MKRLYSTIAILITFGVPSFAQDIKPRFEFSVAPLFSLNQKTMSQEFSLAYSWDRVALKANFESYGLVDADDVFGESISFIAHPAFPSTKFALCPEVGAGIVHGKFSGTNQVSVKPQLYVGAVLDYEVFRNLGSGLILRWNTFGPDIWSFFLGLKIAARF